jgi:hypothetical protein
MRPRSLKVVIPAKFHSKCYEKGRGRADPGALTCGNSPKGGTEELNSFSVTHWKKQADGKWKVIADIWNTDK